jgi:hypothetical protein
MLGEKWKYVRAVHCLFTELKTAELTQSQDQKVLFETLEFINCIWNKDDLLQQWRKLITVPIYKVIKLFVEITEAYHLSTTYNY